MVALAAAALISAGALAGCAPAQTSSSGSTAATSSNAGAPLVGAGATFPAPVYGKWAQDFTQVEPATKVNYQAIGSGGGIQQFTAGTVNFGATDVPLQDAEAAKIAKPYLQFPTVLGAVVVAYNLKGVTTPLKVDGPTTANIFLGTIKKWNDPAIAALNPGVALPDQAIQVVHRADGSGTTGIFTGWLKKESPAWSTKVGSGKSVQWPVGQGGNGNAGVATAMKQTDGSIGYLEYQYAISTGLGVSSVKAPDGQYVAPSVASVTKAGEGLAFPITSTTNILDSAVPGAYPISSATYILIYVDQAQKDKAQALVDFWTWCLTKGQSQVATLNYAPLPAKVQASSLAEVAKITSGGSPVTASSVVK
jgi:phosphate transport system substrate-binding protein